MTGIDGVTPSSFEDFAEAQVGALLALARVLADSPEDAEELVQESLLRIYRHWRRGSRADDPPAYARRVLVNQFPQLAAGPPAPGLADERVRRPSGPTGRCRPPGRAAEPGPSSAAVASEAALGHRAAVPPAAEHRRDRVLDRHGGLQRAGHA